MMAQIPGGIPPPLDDDVDDVAWALQTAQVQWKRAAYADAIVWLRRAIDAAMQAGQAQRANDLSAAAWRLTELMLSQAEPEAAPEPARPQSTQPADGGDIDALLQDASEDIPISVGSQRPRQDSADTERKLTPAPARSSVPSAEQTLVDERISIEPISSVPVDDEATEAMEVGPGAYPTPVPPAFPAPHADRSPRPALFAQSSAARSVPARPPAQAHTFDAQATENTPIEVPRPTLPGAPRPSASPAESRRPQTPAASPAEGRRPQTAAGTAASRAQQTAPQAAPRPQQASAARPTSSKSSAAAHASSRVMRPPPPEVPAPREPESDFPLPRFPSDEEETIEGPMPMMVSEHALDRRPRASPEPPLEDVLKTEAPPFGAPSPTEPPPEVPTQAPPPGTPLPALSLVDVRALQDLTEDAQIELAAQARMETLSRGGELGPCAIALVLDGWVTVTSAIAQVGCARVAAGDLVCTFGSLTESVELSVVAGQDDTLVAVWDAALVDRVTADCPWVVDDLRAIGDRFQALVGVTMGAMGDRLDDALRAMVTERCEVRTLGPGEQLVEGGKPVPGMHIVGVGRIEIVRGEGDELEITDELGPGDFLFAAEVLAAGPAPAAARAGKTGALVLFAPRKVAHELLVSVPPLLEIFAS